MRRLPAYPVYLILQGVGACLWALMTTVNLVYQAQVAHLNPLQLVLVGTVLEATCFLSEVPTGIVADVYSRRLSVIVGTLLLGAGFVLEGSIPHFEAILLAQVIWGLGATFTSGATEAWISDEVGEERAGQAFLRGAQVAQVGALVGIVPAIALGNVRLNLPMVVGGSLQMGLGVFLALAMPEQGWVRAAGVAQHSWRAMGDTVRRSMQALRARPVLVTILAGGAVYGMFSEGLDRLWTVHLLDDLRLPALGRLGGLGWFGVISAGGMLLALVATALARRYVDTNDGRSLARWLLLIQALLIAAVVGLGLAGHWLLALALLWAIGPLRSVRNPLYTAWVNQRLDSSVRATLISFSAQVDALGQIIGGPLLGALAGGVSVRAALVAAGLVLGPALWLYAATLRGHSPGG